MPISRGLASLDKFQTVYGLEDAFLLLEIAAVDTHNANCWSNHGNRP
ncbi:MAG: hypothetical protein PHI96_00765 [Desulfovibrio sp.]|nr:hypothetical protein [Desulfovibrio sp.]